MCLDQFLQMPSNSLVSSKMPEDHPKELVISLINYYVFEAIHKAESKGEKLSRI